MNDKKCPVCESDQLVQIEENVPLTAGDFVREMVMHATECQSCGCSFYTSDQERFNKRQRLAFRKQVEGLLPGEQIRAIRQRHNLTQKQAAEIFGGGPVAFAKYEADDVAQSQAMDRLIRVFDEIPDVRSRLMGRAVVQARAELLIEDHMAVFYRALSIDVLTQTRRILNAEHIVRNLVTGDDHTVDVEPVEVLPVEWRTFRSQASGRRH